METIGRDLNEMQRVPLAADHVAALRRTGTIVRYEAGETVVDAGEAADRFIYVEEGEIEVVDPFTGERRVPSAVGPTQFVGEIGLLFGGNWTMPMRAARDTRAIVVPRPALLKLMADIPEMSDIIITVLAARRRRQLDLHEGTLVLIGEEADRDIARIAQFVGRNRLPYSSYPLGSVEAARIAESCAVPPDQPAVVYGKDRVVTDPTLEKIAQLLGVNRDLVDDEPFDVLIVGGGPAGVAAAVYAGAEGLSALVVEDVAVGGQAGTSSRIENYLGFPTGISGADLVWRGEVQAMKFGSRFVMPRRAQCIERLADGCFCITLDNGQRVRAGAVIVATGVQYKQLPIARLAEYEGAGVYYAATELEARYCRNSEAVVIGGGNSAGQAAMYLSRAADHVRLLVRGPTLAASMSNYLSSRLHADPAVTVEHGTEVVALHGSDRLEAVTIRDVGDGTTRTIPTCALFVMVGAEPNTGWLEGLAKVDAKGFVLTGDAAGAASAYATSEPGIFAVGDVRAGSVKRVASAVGEGSVVISKVWEYLNA
jgi:thioredoxin reductase (NADPH)